MRLDLSHAEAVQIRQAMPQPGDCVSGGGAGAGGVGGAPALPVDPWLAPVLHTF